MTVFLYFICYSRLITFISYNVGFTPTYVFFDSSKIYIDIFSVFFKALLWRGEFVEGNKIKVSYLC